MLVQEAATESWLEFFFTVVNSQYPIFWLKLTCGVKEKEREDKKMCKQWPAMFAITPLGGATKPPGPKDALEIDYNFSNSRNPYEERTAHAYHVYSGTGHGSWGYSGMVS